MYHFSKAKGLPRTKRSFGAGFSLIELLVSLGIAGVLLTVVVLNQRGYTEGALLSNTVDNLGLSVSQAQAYGLAVREKSPGTSDFLYGYGLSLSFLEDGGENGFIMFRDNNNSQYYDGGWPCGVSECLEKTEFSGGNYIEDFCVLRTQGADQCGTVGRVDISFKRPVPDARIFLYNTGGNSYNLPNLKGVKIIIKSPSGLTRYVTVYVTGQISVQ